MNTSLRKIFSLSLALMLYLTLLPAHTMAAQVSSGMTPADARSKGIDVSVFQGKIDWAKVKGHIDFAILRCGYGSDNPQWDDKEFARNAAECEKYGIPYGVYLYSYATDTVQAQSEARHTLRLLEGLHPTLPVFLDLEDDSILKVCSASQILANATAYCLALEQAGYRVGIYANLNWWTTYLTSSTYDRWERWVAQYGNAATLDRDFNYWQYSETGTVPGITGKVDMNYARPSFAPGTIPNPFFDVKETDYFCAPVLWALDKGVTGGTSATTFSPHATCTRGQVVTFLWAANGRPAPQSTACKFTDVSPKDYFYRAILWAVEQGITTGTSDTTFSPQQGCTRGQVATFLWAANGRPAPQSTACKFTDVTAADYFYQPVLWAVEQGITGGTSATTFSPEDTCTRGQIATFLFKACP